MIHLEISVGLLFNLIVSSELQKNTKHTIKINKVGHMSIKFVTNVVHSLEERIGY